MQPRISGCGNVKAHEAHYVVHLDRQCRGYTREEEDLRTLFIKLHTAWPPHSEIPEGVKLVMHPSVHHSIMRYWEPDFSDWERRAHEEPSAAPAGVEVVIDQSLPHGGWMLVAAAGKVDDGLG